jgi:hypothetical protein
MAYVSQELKAKIAPLVKKICAQYGMKGSLSVQNHSTLVLTVKEGKLPFPESDTSVNPYHYLDHYTGKQREFLHAVIQVMNTGNHNRSDIMTDYFDVGWYISVNIGRWNKPYKCVM